MNILIHGWKHLSGWSQGPAKGEGLQKHLCSPVVFALSLYRHRELSHIGLRHRSVNGSFDRGLWLAMRGGLQGLGGDRGRECHTTRRLPPGTRDSLTEECPPKLNSQ